jgi:hypothetical protein
MKTAALGQAKIETTAQDASSGRVVVRTAETPLACFRSEQQLRGWRVGAAFTAIREAIAQWGRRIRARDKPNTLHDQRAIRRTRAESGSRALYGVLVDMTWPARQEASNAQAIC